MTKPLHPFSEPIDEIYDTTILVSVSKNQDYITMLTFRSTGTDDQMAPCFWKR